MDRKYLCLMPASYVPEKERSDHRFLYNFPLNLAPKIREDSCSVSFLEFLVKKLKK